MLSSGRKGTSTRLRAISAVVTAFLLCGCLFAYAPALTYRGFDDVPEDAWYVESINRLNERGLLPYGYSPHFQPDEAATTADLAYILAKSRGEWVRSTKCGENWAEPYLEALSGYTGTPVSQGPLTRMEAARLLASALHLHLAAVSAPSPFSDTNDGSAVAIFNLGLIVGTLEDGTRLFAGEAPITRAQMAAVGARLVELADLPSQESDIAAPQNIPYAGTGIDPYTPLPDSPVSINDFRQVFEYMMVQNLDEVQLPYEDAGTEEEYATRVDAIKAALHQFRYERSEYFAYYEKATVKMDRKLDGSGVLSIQISTPGHNSDALKNFRAAAFSSANNILSELYASGTLDSSMSEAERARVLTEWVAYNTVYKHNNDRMDHTAWSVFTENTGVCDGFASALQILLNLDNIQCWGQYGYVKGTNEPHQWTIAVLDGKLLGIDATFFKHDKSSFGMVQEVMNQRYSIG